MTRLPDHRLDPPEQSARDYVIADRVYEMCADPFAALEWLGDVADDCNVAQKIALLLSKRFDDDGRAEADSLRLDLANKFQSWCRAQVEAQAKGEG